MSVDRRYDIDWLRVLAMCSVFVFHCGRFFDTDPWHVKNPQVYAGMDVFTGFLVQWMMPLFFVLSAISSYYALGFRSTGTFIKGRLKRLGIPFLLGTVFLLVPVQVYIERLTNGQFEGSFWQFYPVYFKGWYGFGGNFAWMGLHLWYLAVLFIFSLLMLPFFLWLRKAEINKRYNFILHFLYQPVGLITLAIPLMVVEILMSMNPQGLGQRGFGGWSLFTYLVFFALGYIVTLSDHFRKSIIRYRYFWLSSCLLLTISGMIFLNLGLSYLGIPMSALRSLNSWCWILTFLGFAGRYLTGTNKFLKYANIAVLPFYVLHQTVIVVIAFFMIKLDMGLAGKWPLLGVLSFLIIILLYEFLVRRFNLTRFLFGLKKK